MSMSRKHYQAFAALLAAERAIAPLEANRTVDNVTLAIADLFAQDNPRFDRYRFYDAAGRE